MKLVIGLGNLGKIYSQTRHNTGFRAVDALVKKNGWKMSKKFQALLAETTYNGEKVLLVKPQTYMNQSGKAIKQLTDFYKIKIKDILVIFDDIDLLVGQVRFRSQGQAGGHNGLDSIIESLDNQNIARIKIGIGENKTGKQEIAAEKYVLQPFNKISEKKIKKVIENIPNLVSRWLNNKIKNETFEF